VPISINCTPDDSLPRYEAVTVAVRERVNTVSHPKMLHIAIAGDPLDIGQEPVHVEPDAGLIHVAFRPGPDSPLSAHLMPATFTWEDPVPPILGYFGSAESETRCSHISHVASPKKLPWSLERKASIAARLSPRRKDGPWPG